MTWARASYSGESVVVYFDSESRELTATEAADLLAALPNAIRGACRNERIRRQQQLKTHRAALKSLQQLMTTVAPWRSRP